MVKNAPKAFIKTPHSTVTIPSSPWSQNIIANGDKLEANFFVQCQVETRGTKLAVSEFHVLGLDIKNRGILKSDGLDSFVQVESP